MFFPSPATDPTDPSFDSPPPPPVPGISPATDPTDLSIYWPPSPSISRIFLAETNPPVPSIYSAQPESPPPLSPSVPLAPPPDGGLPTRTPVGLTVGIVIGIGVLIVLAGVCIFYRKKNRRSRQDNVYSDGSPQRRKNDSAHIVVASNPSSSIKVSTPPPHSWGSSSLGSEKSAVTSTGYALNLSLSTFSYEELAMATNGFSAANFLGEGGFGRVYKGVLPNGKVVAIKQMKSDSAQGEREFRAEVEVISRVHHRHLVSLVGYCIAKSHRMLAYEFVPNNTLHFHLHGKQRPTMNWPARMKIALDCAKGLTYLHEDCHPKIIHRDIKAANILLDYNFEAKVADFGLAKLTLDTDTHVTTRVMGTFGYLAPEYAASGQLTDKSDVFSFGVVLLELITGRQPLDKTKSVTDNSMVNWARPLLMQALENGKFDAFVDPRLQNAYNYNEMARIVACAAACVRLTASNRPRMSQIVRALEGNLALDDLNEGMKPRHNKAFGLLESADYDTSQEHENGESVLLKSLYISGNQ